MLSNSLTCLAGNYWLLITNLDVFIYGNAKIDDCADLSKISYQKKPVAYIRRETRFSNEYFEFSIKVRDVEMLATGGLWGEIENKDIIMTPFKGLSIPNLPKEITGLVSNPSSNDIFVINSNSPVRSYRTINHT